MGFSTPSFGIGRSLTAPLLPHHRTNGSRIRRFGRLSQGTAKMQAARQPEHPLLPHQPRFHPLEARAPRMRYRGSLAIDDSSLLLPSRGTVRAFDGPPPTVPSADFFLAVRGNRFPLSQFLPHAESQGTGKISRGKTQNIPRIDAEFIKHTPMGKSVRRPSVCATGLPSLPRALGLGATLRCQAPPAPPSAALRSSHTPARPQW